MYTFIHISKIRDMNKSILIGIAAFGGLILIAVLLPNTSSDNTQELEQVIAEQKVPENVSSIVPIYPNTTVRSVSDNEGVESRDLTVSLFTTDTVAEINKWYREAMSKNGWGIKSDRNIAGYTILQAEHGNVYTSMQAASDGSEGGSVISQHIKIRNQ